MVILVIDDDSISRKMIERNLAGSGHSLVMAKDGAHGLKYAVKKKPEAILLDINMPGIDGFEVLRRLKKESRTHEIPVCMLTSKGQMSDVEKALGLGASDYITKPTSLQERERFKKMLEYKLAKF